MKYGYDKELTFHLRRGIEPRPPRFQRGVQPLHLPQGVTQGGRGGSRTHNITGVLSARRMPFRHATVRADGGIRTRDLLHGKQAF